MSLLLYKVHAACRFLVCVISWSLWSVGKRVHGHYNTRQLLVIINYVHITLYHLVTCSSPVHFLMWIVTKKKHPEPDRASTVTIMVCAIVSRVDFHWETQQLNSHSLLLYALLRRGEWSHRLSQHLSILLMHTSLNVLFTFYQAFTVLRCADRWW